MLTLILRYVIKFTGVLDYSEYGPGRDPFRSLTEKKLKETVIVAYNKGHKIDMIDISNCIKF